MEEPIIEEPVADALPQHDATDQPYGFLKPDHGEIYDHERRIEFDFWWYRLHDSRPVITISYTKPGGGGRFEIFPPFRPTAMTFADDDRDRVLVAGLEEDGSPVLVEYRFQFEKELQVLIDAEPFADVSALQSIADIRIVEGMHPFTVQVLDGRSGKFGFVRKDGRFQAQVGPAHAEALRGKLSIWESHEESDSAWPRLNLWPLPSNTCANPEDGATLILDPPLSDGTQYSNEVRFF